MNTLINPNYASIYDKLCYLNVEAVFRSIFQNSKNFVNRLHRVLNVVEKKIALHKWTVNRETDLMNLIRL